MRCAGCKRELEIGDHYIEDTASGFIQSGSGGRLDQESDPKIDSLVADILGGDDTLSGGAGGKVIYCTDCTEPGGDYLFSTYYGDEDDR